MMAALFSVRLNRLVLATSFALPVFLAGCASLGQQEIAAGNAAHVPAYQESINLNGRISVQYEQNGQPQSLHGSFLWSQTPQGAHLELLSPLGQTVATIDVKPGMATLVQSGRAPQMAADVDQLAAQSLGWPLPVSGMRQWLQGRGTDASGKAFVAAEDDKHNNFSTRDGWRVTYANWENVDGAAKGDAHPKRIDLIRNTEQAGRVSIRIAVDSWIKP